MLVLPSVSIDTCDLTSKMLLASTALCAVSALKLTSCMNQDEDPKFYHITRNILCIAVLFVLTARPMPCKAAEIEFGQAFATLYFSIVLVRPFLAFYDTLLWFFPMTYNPSCYLFELISTDFLASGELVHFLRQFLLKF